MSDNLTQWNKFADIDPSFTKPITGKDYKGTSPNAHYIIRCLTEMFGPVGQGFGWRVLQEGIERFEETSIHWCRIEFWHTDRANTFEAYGQTKMAYRTSKGQMKVDEDAPKKSMTDAITKSAAQVGIAANIFLGRWDDNKYVQKVEEEFRQEKNNQRDPTEVSTKMIEAVDGAQNLDVLKGILTDKRFNDDKDWLKAEHPTHADMVRIAVDKKRLEFKHAED